MDGHAQICRVLAYDGNGYFTILRGEEKVFVQRDRLTFIPDKEEEAMNTIDIDRAALIEQAASEMHRVMMERRACIQQGVTLLTTADIDVAELLAPIRERHVGIHKCENGSWWTDDPNYRGQVAMKGKCRTVRLLDAIEAEVAP